MKYAVSPQEAYEQHANQNGGVSARGDLTYVDDGSICVGCRRRACYYSMAGFSELRISGMCEPCFDFIAVPPSDREALDAWMELVKYAKPRSQ